MNDFVLRRREDRMAFPDERRKLIDALRAARAKLETYYERSNAKYSSDMVHHEHRALLRQIDEALNA